MRRTRGGSRQPPPRGSGGNWRPLGPLLALSVLLLALAAQQARAVVVIDGAGSALSEQDLLELLRDPDVRQIYVMDSLALSPELWPVRAVELARRVEIFGTVRGWANPVLDISRAARGAIYCIVSECSLSVRGPMTFLNPALQGPPSFDFQTPFPTIFSVAGNASIDVRDVDVVTPGFYGLWNSSNLVFQPNQWCVGPPRCGPAGGADMLRCSAQWRGA